MTCTHEHARVITLHVHHIMSHTSLLCTERDLSYLDVHSSGDVKYHLGTHMQHRHASWSQHDMCDGCDVQHQRGVCVTAPSHHATHTCRYDIRTSGGSLPEADAHLTVGQSIASGGGQSCCGRQDTCKTTLLVSMHGVRVGVDSIACVLSSADVLLAGGCMLECASCNSM